MFRRSGGFNAYFVDGKVPAADSPEFAAALATQRFRTIETAASEETSIGWVSPGDPTGNSFEAEDLILDDAVWLRFRADKKKLPPIWVTIHRNEAERSRGKPMSARERKELRVELERQLLPRLLPGVQLIDALWHPDRRLVLLFATGNSMAEEFKKLFVKTFGAQLIEAGPEALAERSGLSREALAYLPEVSPVRWPRQGDEPVRAPAPALTHEAPEDEANDGDGDDASALEVTQA